MPVPKIWRRRSNAMKVVTILITITLIIHIVSMVTDKWMTNSETYGDNGLWSYTVQRKTAPPGAVPALYPLMAVLSFVILLIDQVINIFFLHKNFMAVMTTLVILPYVAGLLYGIVLILWLISHAQVGTVGWSMGLAILVVALDFLIGSLCLMECVMRFKQEPPVYTGKDGPVNTESDNEL